MPSTARPRWRAAMTSVTVDMVRVVRHSARVSLKDILENVYDNYAEIGGQDEYSIDPSMMNLALGSHQNVSRFGYIFFLLSM